MTTSQRTVFVFTGEAAQTKAKDQLLALNIPFQANLTYPFWIDTTAKRANQHNLTSTLQYFKCFSNR